MQAPSGGDGAAALWDCSLPWFHLRVSKMLQAAPHVFWLVLCYSADAGETFLGTARRRRGGGGSARVPASAAEGAAGSPGAPLPPPALCCSSAMSRTSKGTTHKPAALWSDTGLLCRLYLSCFNLSIIASPQCLNWARTVKVFLLSTFGLLLFVPVSVQ